MKILNISQVLEGIQILPEIDEPVGDSMQIERYLNLLELLSEDYISSEHLLVPEKDWSELGQFMCDLQGSEKATNPHAEMIRKKSKTLLYLANWSRESFK
jgi:hypothetical protein